MYCKHCGKQIDDDSTFCKYCGKSLEESINPLEDSSNSSENPNKSFKSLVNLGKRRIDIILALVLWMIIGLMIAIGSINDHFPTIQRLVSLLLTLVIVGILYWFYKNHCKYPILFFDNSDSKKVKILKYIYMVYTIVFPLAAIGSTNYLDDYEGVMFWGWLVPSIIICRIYYNLKNGDL